LVCDLAKIVSLSIFSSFFPKVSCLGELFYIEIYRKESYNGIKIKNEDLTTPLMVFIF